MGATGRLGRMLQRHWAGPGGLPAGAVTWGARQAGPGAIAGARLQPCDPLADPEGLAALARGRRAVLCLAGVTPAAAARGVAWADDTGLALAALAAAEAAGAHAFVCSSAAVYGRAGGVLQEDAAPSPAAPYGESKAAMEAAVLERAGRTGQGVTILRIGNVAGADAILGGWRAGFTLDRFADGTTPARSYIGPAGLARVLAGLAGLAGRQTLPQVLNIAAPGPVAMGALLDAAGLAWTPRPAPDTAIARVELATDRLQGLVPLDPASPGGLVAEWQADREIGATTGPTTRKTGGETG